MQTEDNEYHTRRERDHRALAEAAVTAAAKQAHLNLAEQHGAKARARR